MGPLRLALMTVLYGHHLLTTDGHHRLPQAWTARLGYRMIVGLRRLLPPRIVKGELVLNHHQHWTGQKIDAHCRRRRRLKGFLKA